MAESIGNKNSKWHQFNVVMLPYYFLLPMYILMASMVLYPTLNVFYYSFQNIYPSKPWITGFAGFDNYVKIFTEDQLFRDSILNSFKWCFVQVALQFVFGLIFALVLNITFKGRGAIRALNLRSLGDFGVMVAILWSLDLQPERGRAQRSAHENEHQSGSHRVGCKPEYRIQRRGCRGAVERYPLLCDLAAGCAAERTAGAL